MLGPAVRLARDVPELDEWVRDAREELDGLYRKGARVMLDGTQGTALSIHHGPYPHVMLRETSRPAAWRTPGHPTRASAAWS